MSVSSITTKFILGVLIANTVVLGVFYFVSIAGFQQQLLSFYIDEEKQEVASFVELIENDFQLSTQRESDVPQRWRFWIMESFGTNLLPPPKGREKRRIANSRRYSSDDKPNSSTVKRPPPKRKGNSARANQHNESSELSRRLALYYEDKQRWVGPHDLIPQHYFPILGRDGLIGFVGYMPPNTLFSGASDAFLNAFVQSQKFLLLALLIMNLFLAFLFARYFINPVKWVMKSARNLTSGRYTPEFIDQVRSDELGELMKNMDTLASTLDKQQQSQQRWLADIAHELRTPLAILIGEIEAILDGIRPSSREQIVSLQQEALHLQRLVEDLRHLSLSEMGALDYHFEKVDVADLLTELIAGLKTTIVNNGLTFSGRELDKCYFISADATRITQVFHNLMVNSCRYTDSPGVIELAITQDNTHVSIVLSDSAPTVAKDKLDCLFEPLYRGDSARERVSGSSGLGMSICRAIIKAHQGSIFASQSVLGGIAVTVIFPRINNE